MRPMWEGIGVALRKWYGARILLAPKAKSSHMGKYALYQRVVDEAALLVLAT